VIWEAGSRLLSPYAAKCLTAYCIYHNGISGCPDSAPEGDPISDCGPLGSIGRPNEEEVTAWRRPGQPEEAMHQHVSHSRRVRPLQDTVADMNQRSKSLCRLPEEEKQM